MPADLYPHRPLTTPDDDAVPPGPARDRDAHPRCHAIIAAPGSGWDQLAMGEWELSAQGFGDCHAHDEVTYLLQGVLEIDCDGERVTARPGDVVRVPAGHPAYYYAPDYARMLFIYGPNPSGVAAWTFPDRARVAPPS